MQVQKSVRLSDRKSDALYIRYNYGQVSVRSYPFRKVVNVLQVQKTRRAEKERKNALRVCVRQETTDYVKTMLSEVNFSYP